MECANRSSTRTCVRIALAVLVLAAGIRFSQAADNDPISKSGIASQSSLPRPKNPSSDVGAGASVQQSDRLREGARLTDAKGSFGFAGDRIAFHPDGSSDSFRVLENLALERISRVLSEGHGPRSWIVSGTIMEYRGTNFLLVQKAVIRNDEGRRP